MDRFAAWFQSAAGAWQTFFVLIGAVILEFVNPHLDAHGFWLLYWLTVYSAVTQPALAYINGLAANEAKRMAELQTQMLRNQQDSMQALLAIATKLTGDTEVLKTDVLPMLKDIEQHVEDLTDTKDGQTDAS